MAQYLGRDENALVPQMNSRDIRNTIRNETVQQAAQDPMAQVMQMMQMQQQQNELDQNPMQQAMAQLQMELEGLKLNTMQQQAPLETQGMQQDVDYRAMMNPRQVRDSDQQFQQRQVMAPLEQKGMENQLAQDPLRLAGLQQNFDQNAQRFPGEMRLQGLDESARNNALSMAPSLQYEQILRNAVLGQQYEQNQVLSPYQLAEQALRNATLSRGLEPEPEFSMPGVTNPVYNASHPQ